MDESKDESKNATGDDIKVDKKDPLEKDSVNDRTECSMEEEEIDDIGVGVDDCVEISGQQKTSSISKTEIDLNKNNEKNEDCSVQVEKKEDCCVKDEENKICNDLSEKKQTDSSVIKWEDNDDYLLHLQEILSRIHKAYYEMYEQCQKNGSKELPDLKNIVPYVKKKVLKGVNIVFSGMFPLNMSLEKSRAFMVAKALGAKVQTDFVVKTSKTSDISDSDLTTHLVAAKPGTGKHKTAQKSKTIQVVSGDWLWACNERWEWVNEKLFPLKGKESPGTSVDSPEPGKVKISKKRKAEKMSLGDDDNSEDGARTSDVKIKKQLKMDISDQSTSKDETVEETFAKSYNPLLSFSDEDIEFMGKEVDEILEESGNSDSESDTEREDRMRRDVLGKPPESDSDSDSLSGDLPRGWKLRRKSISPQHKSETEDPAIANDEDTENELDKYEKNMAAFAPADSSSDSQGSVDDEFAQALEKEFLSGLYDVGKQT